MRVEAELATRNHSGEHCRHGQRVSFLLTLEPKHHCDDDDDDDANGSDDGDNDAVICILMQEKK